MTNVVQFQPNTEGASANANAARMADSMLQHSAKMVKECLEQREEILRAFVAQHGFNPDEAMQIEREGTWRVIKIDKSDVDKLRRAVILARIAKEKPTLWQSFCLWLAGFKSAKPAKSVVKKA